MGNKIKIKIIKHGKYVFTISFENLYLIKNNMDKIAKRKIPSERTIVQKDASMNENIIAFC